VARLGAMRLTMSANWSIRWLSDTTPRSTSGVFAEGHSWIVRVWKPWALSAKVIIVAVSRNTA